MKVLDLKIFEGRNIYAHFPVSKITVDLGHLAHRESSEYEGFVERLVKLLPGLREHQCSGHAGGFALRLRSGTYFGHVVEHVFLELQALSGVAPLTDLSVELIQACLEDREVDLARTYVRPATAPTTALLS